MQRKLLRERKLCFLFSKVIILLILSNSQMKYENKWDSSEHNSRLLVLDQDTTFPFGNVAITLKKSPALWKNFDPVARCDISKYQYLKNILDILYHSCTRWQFQTVISNFKLLIFNHHSNVQVDL